MTAAIPFKYSGMSVAIIWLVGAQALLFCGIALRETAFTRLGGLGSLLTAGHLLLVDARPNIETAAGGGAVNPVTSLGVALLAAAAVMFASGVFLPRRWEAIFGDSW